ncbi:MAG: P-II family nitrogen regulator [Planctomycetaceae bacterium]
MKAVKRIEIITGPIEFRSVVDALEAAGITGYAVIRDVLGKGDKRVNSWDSLSSEPENLMVVTTIPAERLQPLVETIRPVLQQFGGACLVSDAMWVIH